MFWSPEQPAASPAPAPTPSPSTQIRTPARTSTRYAASSPPVSQRTPSYRHPPPLVPRGQLLYGAKHRTKLTPPSLRAVTLATLTGTTTACPACNSTGAAPAHSTRPEPSNPTKHPASAIGITTSRPAPDRKSVV